MHPVCYSLCLALQSLLKISDCFADFQLFLKRFSYGPWDQENQRTESFPEGTGKRAQAVKGLVLENGTGPLDLARWRSPVAWMYETDRTDATGGTVI